MKKISIKILPGLSLLALPFFANAADVSFANPLGLTSLSQLLGNILSNLSGVIGIIAIIFIVIGGLMYMLSGGNEKTMDRAKMTITGAVIGLAIALAAPTFLKELIGILGGGGGTNPDELINKALTIKEIAMKTLNFLLSVAGVVAIIGLVIGGMMYMTAYGDEDRLDKGKKIITYSIIGIVVILTSLVIVKQVATLIGA